MPDFIERGGELALPPPYLLERALLRGFFLHADDASLCRYIAQTIGRVTTERFSPIDSTVLVSFAHLPKISSASNPDGAWSSETEAAVWLPLRREKDQQLYWLLPYVFVDNPYAMASGREVFGFPKSLGRFVIPERTEHAAYLLEAFCLREDNRELCWQPLLSLQPKPPTIESKRKQLSTLLSLNWLQSSLSGELRFLFLRQLRDIAAPEQASYQELLTTTARVKKIYGFGPLPGSYSLQLTPRLSHPIAKELGLQAEHPVEGAYWTEFDFILARGERLSLSAAGREKKKVAILGGGIGSLSAALALTEDPSWRERLEITIYQTGWRLGGKCASSRNPKANHRIEEHGLHVWFGSYERAFRMLRRCFDELARDPSHPMPDWRSAFLQQGDVSFIDRTSGEAVQWLYRFPVRPGEPGETGEQFNPERWLSLFGSWVSTIGAALHSQSGRVNAGLRALLQGVETPDLKRIRHVLNLFRAIVRGMLRDRVFTRGLASLNDQDFIEWLIKHGASPQALSVGPIEALYDLVLATYAGPEQRPDFAAGTALGSLLGLLLGYKGSLLWKMRAGMGETVITPLYEVLQRRGVHFKFFHSVQRLGLSADEQRLSTITMTRQATPKKEYQPLIDIDGLGCWPDAPLYEQLQEGDSLRGVDLEHPPSGWSGAEQLTLQRGVDFDLVVLGIPIAALPAICHEIVEARPAWRRMLSEVKTAATVSCQLWLKESAAALGREGEGAVQGGAEGLFSTYADMSHLIGAERWGSHPPAQAAYLCAPLPSSLEGEALSPLARRWLSRWGGWLWPRAKTHAGFNWSLLLDQSEQAGVARLASQYLRSNTAPSERYTLSVKGSHRYRLSPGGSQVEGLFLTGDWVDNGINIGCIEATVTAGELCAAVIQEKLSR